MPLDVEYVSVEENVENVYVFEYDDPDNRHLAFEIRKKEKIILFYPRDNFISKIVYLEGFTKIPPEINEKGYFKAGLTYYLNKKLSEQKVNHLTISKTSSNSLRKRGKNYKMVLNYDSFKSLKTDVAYLNSESKLEKSHTVNDFFSNTFPRKYSSSKISASFQAKKVLNNLNTTIIEKFSPEDLTKVLNFVQDLLKLKYKSLSEKHKLFSIAKLKVDDIAISQILNEFEIMLSKKPNENKWGDFLKKNLFLLDSKYVSVIPELNLVLSTQRKVDFGLVDSQGFLDIFEIKKPDAPILAKKTDRGNYYWSTDLIKAITQAEKYLYQAESKKDSLANDIKRENDLNVSVIKPRAFLLVGMSEQLKSSQEIEDFRILRMSLKNVEIILYDELFQRLKNQQNKIYLD